MLFVKLWARENEAGDRHECHLPLSAMSIRLFLTRLRPDLYLDHVLSGHHIADIIERMVDITTGGPDIRMPSAVADHISVCSRP